MQPWTYLHPLGQTHCRWTWQTQKIDSLREKPFNECVSPFRRVQGSVWRKRERKHSCNEKNEKGVLRFDLRSPVLALLTFVLISSYVSEITLWTHKRHLGFLQDTICWVTLKAQTFPLWIIFSITFIASCRWSLWSHWIVNGVQRRL